MVWLFCGLRPPLRIKTPSPFSKREGVRNTTAAGDVNKNDHDCRNFRRVLVPITDLLCDLLIGTNGIHTQKLGICNHLNPELLREWMCMLLVMYSNVMHVCHICTCIHINKYVYMYLHIYVTLVCGDLRMNRWQWSHVL